MVTDILATPQPHLLTIKGVAVKLTPTFVSNNVKNMHRRFNQVKQRAIAI